MSDAPILAMLAAALTAEPVYQSDMAETDPRLPRMRAMGDLFTTGVAVLCARFPNPRIATLMRQVWDLVGHKIVPAVLGVPVASLHLAVVPDGGGQLVARILVPEDWPAMAAKDAILQYGALVWTGSLAVDFYNDRYVPPDALRRAYAHEAEFYLALKRLDPTWRPNPYQRQVLADYPQGLDSPQVQGLLYEPREIVTA